MRGKSIVEFFEEVEPIEEYESYDGYFCNIADAISIVVLGTLCGFKNVYQIHNWAATDRMREFLKEEFGIKHVPCYYWILTLLKMIKTDSLSRCLTKWAEQFLPEDRGGITISLDGKTIRSTNKLKNIKDPLHIISAQICEMGITLASQTVKEKSNEIPAVQELLKKIDIKGCIVVADALNSQKETAEVIIEGKGDYLLNIKGNQRVLEEQIALYVQDKDSQKEMEKATTKEKNGGRIETRTGYITKNIDWIEGKENWKNIKSIGGIKAQIEENGKKTITWRYYISSRELTAKELLNHARMEWSVESMHWILDVDFGEDYCRIEDRNVQESLNLVRKYAINLLKRYKEKIKSKAALTTMMIECIVEPKKLRTILENTVE